MITGFVALVDPAAGGRNLEALVGITLSPGVDSDPFAVEASRLEPVIEVLHLTGAPDYQLRVACRDTAELDTLLRTLRLRHGAADTETTIVLRSGPPREEPVSRSGRSAPAPAALAMLLGGAAELLLPAAHPRLLEARAGTRGLEQPEQVAAGRRASRRSQLAQPALERAGETPLLVADHRIVARRDRCPLAAWRIGAPDQPAQDVALVGVRRPHAGLDQPPLERSGRRTMRSARVRPIAQPKRSVSYDGPTPCTMARIRSKPMPTSTLACEQRRELAVGQLLVRDEDVVGDLHPVVEDLGVRPARTVRPGRAPPVVLRASA